MKCYYNNGDNITSLIGKKVLLHHKDGGVYAGKIVREHKFLDYIGDLKYMDSIIFVGWDGRQCDLEENTSSFRVARPDPAFTEDISEFKTGEYLADNNGICTMHRLFVIEIHDRDFDKIWKSTLRENKREYKQICKEIKEKLNKIKS